MMFSRVASSCSTHFGKCFSKFSQSANRLSHFVNQSSRSYSTGSAACRLIDTSNYPLVSPFQLGFAVAAGLGCGAALLYGNRLFAVEVTTWRWGLMHRIRNPWTFLARILTVLASRIIPCVSLNSDASLHPCTLEHHFVPGCHELKIVSGNSNRALADRVAKCLGRG